MVLQMSNLYGPGPLPFPDGLKFAKQSIVNHAVVPRYFLRDHLRSVRRSAPFIRLVTRNLLLLQANAILHVIHMLFTALLSHVVDDFRAGEYNTGPVVSRNCRPHTSSHGSPVKIQIMRTPPEPNRGGCRF